MKWEVEFHKDFDAEFNALPDEVQNELLVHALLLEQFGPQLGRAARRYVKRIASREYEGDPKRNAVLLIAGDKSGVGEKRFYRQLIAKADERFTEHLSQMKKGI